MSAQRTKSPASDPVKPRIVRNTKLLEKVEELTLYIIEINKKVERLEKENQALKGK